MGEARIVVVGGGAYVPALCDALALVAPPVPLDLRLVARRHERAAVVARHAAARLKRTRPDWRVRADDVLERACEGASTVVLLVRVGGAAARRHDERFPARFGLVGDEGLGPGGFANAWRSFPALARIARVLRTHAPSAWVANLVAPLGMTTRWLLAHGLDAVGLCELPAVTELRLGAGPWCYAGLNHIGWFWRPRGSSGPPQPGSCDPETWARFDAAPLPYYYRVFDPRAGERIGERAPAGRADVVASLSERLFRRYAEQPGADTPELAERPTPWFDQLLVPVLAVRYGGPEHTGHASVPNDGRLPFLPDETVVELQARFTSEGPRVSPPVDVPPRVAEFLARVARAEELAYLAAAERRTEVLARALHALPLDVPCARIGELVAQAITPIPEPA